MLNVCCGSKNEPASAGSFLPRKQTSVGYAADCDVIVCYGAAKLADKHLASKVRCVDDEIIGWPKRRETKPRGLRGRDIEQFSFPRHNLF
jgi:hypothetical protein